MFLVYKPRGLRKIHVSVFLQNGHILGPFSLLGILLWSLTAMKSLGAAFALRLPRPLMISLGLSRVMNMLGLFFVGGHPGYLDYIVGGIHPKGPCFRHFRKDRSPGSSSHWSGWEIHRYSRSNRVNLVPHHMNMNMEQSWPWPLPEKWRITTACWWSCSRIVSAKSLALKRCTYTESICIFYNSWYPDLASCVIFLWNKTRGTQSGNLSRRYQNTIHRDVSLREFRAIRQRVIEMESEDGWQKFKLDFFKFESLYDNCKHFLEPTVECISHQCNSRRSISNQGVLLTESEQVDVESWRICRVR